MKSLVTFVMALGLHLTLGWAWTLGAGLIGGFWARRRGWMVGLIGVTLDWSVLLVYNVAVAPDATVRMTRTVGALLGNLPGVATVLATVLVGAGLGVLGGFTGQQLRRHVRPTERSPKTAASEGGRG